MKEFAKGFYSSIAWQNCREAFTKSKGGLCEECLRNGIYSPGEIVHHITEITPENVNDPNITLNFSNLMLLCREHHAMQHTKKRNRRYIIDDTGRVIAMS